MQVIQLSVSQLSVDKDFNVRESKNYGDIDALAAQIAQDGQSTPIEVGPLDATSGKYPVVSGFRRVAAIRKIVKNGADVPVFAVVIDKESAEQAWHNLKENMAREDLTGFEQAKGMARMVNEYGWTQADLIRRFGISETGEKAKGMSQSHVSNMVSAFRDLSPKCLDAWSAGKINTEAALKLKARKDHEEQDALLPLVKGKSGGALIDAVAQFDRGDDIEAADEGASDDEGAAKKRTKKPGPATLRLALAWAKENGDETAIAVLRWVTGSVKRLTIGKDTFDPNASEE